MPANVWSSVLGQLGQAVLNRVISCIPGPSDAQPAQAGAAHAAPGAQPHCRYITNGQIRVGIDASRGCGLCWLSEAQSNSNLLNAFDTGRFIQQSYYGKEDGSNWNGKPWRYNPVQGGSWQCHPSVVKECVEGDCCLTAKVTPRNWGGQQLLPEVEFGQRITLQGRVVKVHFTFSCNGQDEHPVREHEIPAVFLTRALGKLTVYTGNAPWTGAACQQTVPGFPNKYFDPTEKWAAYVNDAGYGVGVYVPVCTGLTAYTVGTDPSQHSNCSYFAPTIKMAIKPGFKFEYDAFITIGQLDDIRATFKQLAHPA